VLVGAHRVVEAAGGFGIDADREPVLRAAQLRQRDLAAEKSNSSWPVGSSRRPSGARTVTLRVPMLANSPVSAASGSGTTVFANSQRLLMRGAVQPARHSSASVRTVPTARNAKRRAEPRIGASRPCSIQRLSTLAGRPQSSASSSTVNVRSSPPSDLTPPPR
jgi:hypothetical protein